MNKLFLHDHQTNIVLLPNKHCAFTKQTLCFYQTAYTEKKHELHYHIIYIIS